MERIDRPPRSGPVDFFISYSLLDVEWAVWIAHQLEDAGYDVMIQSWDFVPGTHFLDFIDRGSKQGLDESFDAVVLSGEVGLRKPDAAIFDQ